MWNPSRKVPSKPQAYQGLDPFRQNDDTPAPPSQTTCVLHSARRDLVVNTPRPRNNNRHDYEHCVYRAPLIPDTGIRSQPRPPGGHRRPHRPGTGPRPGARDDGHSRCGPAGATHHRACVQSGRFARHNAVYGRTVVLGALSARFRRRLRHRRVLALRRHGSGIPQRRGPSGDHRQRPGPTLERRSGQGQSRQSSDVKGLPPGPRVDRAPRH